MLDEGREGVVATVIDVEGSAYRRPGAKMLVSADGSGVGHITAGCLEDEVEALAREVLDAGEPRVEVYDLMEGDDDIWGLGVGCNGVVSVLVEPLDESYRPVVEAFESGTDVGLATVVESTDPDVPAWKRATYRPGRGFDGDLPDWLTEAAADAAATLTDTGKADTVTVEGPGGIVELFVDGLAAPPHLVVVGTGNDAGPVVELGKKNDFRVTVVGFRGASDAERRFADADRVVATSPTELTDAVEFDGRTCVVVMTHNFVDDRLAIGELVGTPVPYVGLLGPRERFEEMLDDFADEGRTFSDDELAAMYTPAGLDLGGGAPYQIALSIVAEALAVVNGREPRHLQEREGPIHDRVDVGGDDGEVAAGPTDD